MSKSLNPKNLEAAFRMHSVDWRWQWANWLAKSNRRISPRRDPPEVARAVRFIRARENNFTGRHAAVFEQERVLIEALNLATTGGTLALEIRARLLAGQSFEMVAVMADCEPAVVHHFAYFFFDVFDRRQQKSFMHSQVIGAAPDKPLSVEQYILSVAFLCGPHAVSMAMDWYGMQDQPVDLSTASGRLREKFELSYAIKCLCSLQGMTPKQAINAARIASQMQQLEAKPVSRADLLKRNLASVLQEIQWQPHSRPDFHPKLDEALQQVGGFD